MRFTPRVLGAVAAILVTGIASGAIIGDVPPMTRLAQQDLLPEANTIAIDYRQDRDLPDHYPLVTPQGRFEVYELADRGLYSQARYAPYPYDEYDEYDEYEYDEYGEHDAELAYAELEAAYAAEPDEEPGAQFAMAARAGEMIGIPPAPVPERRPGPPPPEYNSADAAPAVASVTPRVIDVRKELPARY